MDRLIISTCTTNKQLVLGILDHLLMGSSAAFLYKRLIESGLGESVIGGGLDDTLLQNTFSVGLKGVKPEDYPKVEQLVLQILQVGSWGVLGCVGVGGVGVVDGCYRSDSD